MAKSSNSPYIRLAAAIRARRRSLDLSQTELSEFAGCGLTFVNQLESGKETIRLDKLLDVLKVLGLELTLESGKEVLRVSDNLK